MPKGTYRCHYNRWSCSAKKAEKGEKNHETKNFASQEKSKLNRLIRNYSTDQVSDVTVNLPSSSTSSINTYNTILNRVDNQNFNVDVQAINVEERYIGTMHIQFKYCFFRWNGS